MTWTCEAGVDTVDQSQTVKTLRARVFLSNLYDYVKENAGPVKPGVDTVDQTVVGCVYLKFDGKLLEILHFLD